MGRRHTSVQCLGPKACPLHQGRIAVGMAGAEAKNGSAMKFRHVWAVPVPTYVSREDGQSAKEKNISNGGKLKFKNTKGLSLGFWVTETFMLILNKKIVFLKSGKQTLRYEYAKVGLEAFTKNLDKTLYIGRF